LTAPNDARTFHPAYWIYIGATADVVSGRPYVLWAFGISRHLIRREPVRHETGLWSIVFPLG